MNTYSTSSGERLSTAQINSRIVAARVMKFEQQKEEHGYNFCENCLRNASNTVLDYSHIISIKEAKETGRAELCYDNKNTEILCRDCHKVKDKLDLVFS